MLIVRIMEADDIDVMLIVRMEADYIGCDADC